MDPRRPSLLTFSVAELDRSLAFWHGALGLPIKLRVEGYAELQSETLLLALLESGAPAREAASSPALAWEVTDLDEAAARLEAAGIHVAAATGSGMAGRRRRFRDPDGHALELIAYDE